MFKIENVKKTEKTEKSRGREWEGEGEEDSESGCQDYSTASASGE